jgi:hypothetical protein
LHRNPGSHATCAAARIAHGINLEIHMRELNELEIEAVSGGTSIVFVPPVHEIRLDELAPEIDAMERPGRE